nr:MAG TPA: hypothetical protein [Caudoviricetes sp.]
MCVIYGVLIFSLSFLRISKNTPENAIKHGGCLQWCIHRCIRWCLQFPLQSFSYQGIIYTYNNRSHECRVYESASVFVASIFSNADFGKAPLFCAMQSKGILLFLAIFGK